MNLLSYILRASALLPSLSAAYTTLSDDTLSALPGPGDDFNIHTGALLAPILIPRVPGTPGSTMVLQHFLDFFSQSLPQWHVELHNSSSTTPTSAGKEVPFVNLIATRDPPWAEPGEVGRLALVAHYDSKLTPQGFIGATDSAAPCAMIMHAARSIEGALTRKWARMEKEGVGSAGFDGVEEEKGVQIILLDGEEAFKSWTDSDSLYGARALAESWEETYHPAMSTFQTVISSIQLFLLLDLLGSKDPQVPSYFQTTHWAYKAMAKIEDRLRGLGQLKSSPNYPGKISPQKKPRAEPVFLKDANKGDDRFMGGMVQDDHVPFMARGVEVLHIIPTPFPRVWHQMEDDGQHLDLDTVEDWAKLVTAFTSEWMELEGFFNTTSARRAAVGDTEGDNEKRKRTTGKSEL